MKSRLACAPGARRVLRLGKHESTVSRLLRSCGPYGVVVSGWIVSIHWCAQTCRRVAIASSSSRLRKSGTVMSSRPVV